MRNLIYAFAILVRASDTLSNFSGWRLRELCVRFVAMLSNSSVETEHAVMGKHGDRNILSVRWIQTLQEYRKIAIFPTSIFKCTNTIQALKCIPILSLAIYAIYTNCIKRGT